MGSQRVRHHWASQMALVVKNPSANSGNVRDTALIPVSGRSTGEGHGNPLQYSCPENPIDRGALLTTVIKSQSWPQLKQQQQLLGYKFPLFPIIFRVEPDLPPHPRPAPGNPYSTFGLCDFDYSLQELHIKGIILNLAFYFIKLSNI